MVSLSPLTDRRSCAEKKDAWQVPQQVVISPHTLKLAEGKVPGEIRLSKMQAILRGLDLPQEC